VATRGARGAADPGPSPADTLATPLRASRLPGAASLGRVGGRIGLRTVRDLLLWLPRRYDDLRTVYDLGALQADMAKSMDASAMKASITPNGRTKTIAGRSAAGYDMAISVPTTMGGNADMAMTVNLTGPVWIVKGAPGSADWANFYKQAASKGFIFGDPRAVKGSPGQAKAMVEMYRKMAELGGIAYETETSLKVDGSGPMAGLMAKMGGATMNTSVTDVNAGALADDVFAVPAGYKLKERK
jgi:hypothetical protein